MYESHSRPHGHMGLEAQSRSACPGKWRHLCAYFPCILREDSGGEVNFLCRTPLPPPPPPRPRPLVPTAVRDQTVSPVSSGSRKRPRPEYLELVPSTETFISLPTSSLGNPMTTIPRMTVAGIRMPILFPEWERTDSQSEMIRTTSGHRIRMHLRRAKERSEGDHLPSPSPRKALKKAPTVNISLHLASSSRSSSSPSSMIRGSGSDMLNNAPMGVRHHGAAHGKL